MKHRSLAAPLALIVAAGTTVQALADHAERDKPAPADTPAALTADVDADEVETWLRSLPLPRFAVELPGDGLSTYQSKALSALRAEQDFEPMLAEVTEIGRLLFSRYFAWQIRNIRTESAADGTVFVHTIMNDLARLKTLSEEQVIEIRVERERQYGSLLQPVRARLEQELRAYDLPQSTVDAVMETFDRSAIDTGNFLTNPACAYCDLPAPPEIALRMRRYQEEKLQRVADRLNQAMNRPGSSESWRISGLKFVAMQLEQMVAQDFGNRMAYRDRPEIENAGSPAERTLQPGPYSIFFPTEWDRFSYWRATGSHGWSGGSGSGGFEDPEPFRNIVLRYHPDEDHPNRERYESVHDQPVED